MNKFCLLSVLFLASSVSLGEVFVDSQPSDKGTLSIGAKHDSLQTPAAKAFAAAGAKVQSPVFLYRKDPILYPRSSYGLCTAPADGIPWPRFAIDVRRIAKELVQTQGKDIVPYLKEYTEKCKFRALLALLTLDELGLHEEAAKLALRLLSKKTMHVLLSVSYCSLRTRETTVNMLADLLYEYPRYIHEDYLKFIVAAGNAETLKLLEEKDKKWEEEIEKRIRTGELKNRKFFPKGKSHFAKAASQIRSRLSLSEKKRKQRAKDELLFWQTDAGRESTCNLEGGLFFAARCLVAQKLRITTEYLIEKLNPEEITNETTNHICVAIAIIMFQKENTAIPNMIQLVQRYPTYQELVEQALREIDTPEARKALQDLQTRER